MGKLIVCVYVPQISYLMIELITVVVVVVIIVVDDDSCEY